VRVVLVGQPNVGKTLLLINFAAYLGCNEIVKDAHPPDRLSLERSRRECVSYVAHKHVVPLRASLNPGKSTETSLVLVDTPGIMEGVPGEARQRRAMASSLEELFYAQMILLVIDGGLSTVSPLDDALMGLATRIAPTLIVLNKADVRRFQPSAHRDHFAASPVLAISALTRRGFRDLKQRLYALWEAQS
jgi:50S ribosomal subunit-associated GTPase HflX